MFLLQIIPSRDVKVAGLLGPAAPIEKKTIAVADTAVGMGGTTCWRLAGVAHIWARATGHTFAGHACGSSGRVVCRQHDNQRILVEVHPGWHAGLDSRTSLAAFFEVVAGSHGKAPDVGAAPQFFLQFVTKYLHENGEFRCRVTTVTRTCGSSLPTSVHT